MQCSQNPRGTRVFIDLMVHKASSFLSPHRRACMGIGPGFPNARAVDLAAKVRHPQKEKDVERRKWTVGTSITTLAIAIALAVASIAAAKTISQQNSNVRCTSDEWLWVINQLQNSASA